MYEERCSWIRSELSRRSDCALAHAALFARLPACIARFPTRADGQVALSFHALASSSHWFRVRFYRVGHDMPCWPSCCSDRTKCKIRNMKSWLPPCLSRGLSGERHHSQHRNKRFDKEPKGANFDECTWLVSARSGAPDGATALHLHLCIFPDHLALSLSPTRGSLRSDLGKTNESCEKPVRQNGPHFHPLALQLMCIPSRS